MSTYDTIARSLPLVIRAIEVQDPVVTFIGDDWSLTLMCPWTLEARDISTSWESENLEDEVWNLIGHGIVHVSAGPEVVDPIFHFSGGIALSVHADSDLDPWTLMLPGLVVTGRKGT